MVTPTTIQGSVEFSEDELEDMISIFKTLSDPSRVRIISSLSEEKSFSVGGLADLLDMK